MAPAFSSPAVDQGAAEGLGSDERGVIRPIDFPTIPNAAGGDGSDIGAVELQPSSALTLGKLKKNKKNGTATLLVTLPQPSVGSLTLHGKGLKSQTVAITGKAQVKLKIATTGKAKKGLRKKGKRKVKIEVTYTPTGNVTATATRNDEARPQAQEKKAQETRGPQKAPLGEGVEAPHLVVVGLRPTGRSSASKPRWSACRRPSRSAGPAPSSRRRASSRTSFSASR